MTFNSTNFYGGLLRGHYDASITELTKPEKTSISRFFWSRNVKNNAQIIINLAKRQLADVLSIKLILDRTNSFINQDCKLKEILETENCIKSPYYSREIAKVFLLTKTLLNILIAPPKGKYNILSHNAKKVLEKVNAKIDMAMPVIRIISAVALANINGFDYEMFAGYLITTAVHYAKDSDYISKDNKAHFKSVYPAIGLISGKLFESYPPESFKL